MELSGLWERKADDPYHHSSAFRNLPAEDSYLNRFRLSNEIDARNALLEAFLVTEIAYFPKVLFRRLRGAPNLDAITIRMKNISDQNFNLVHVIVAYYDIQNGTFELERKYFYNVSPNADMEVRKDRPKQDEAVVLAVYPINYTWSE